MEKNLQHRVKKNNNIESWRKKLREKEAKRREEHDTVGV